MHFFLRNARILLSASQIWLQMSTTQQWIAQKFASYTISTSSIPLEFKLSEQTERLAQQNIPLYTMRKELEVLNKITAIANVYHKLINTTDSEFILGFSK